MWDDSRWAEFRTHYEVEPTRPGLNQEQFSKFLQDMSVLEQIRHDEFKTFDRDEDGFLNHNEMKAAAATLYPVGLLVTRHSPSCSRSLCRNIMFV